jgi:hypothetical protein
MNTPAPTAADMLQTAAMAMPMPVGTGESFILELSAPTSTNSQSPKHRSKKMD